LFRKEQESRREKSIAACLSWTDMFKNKTLQTESSPNSYKCTLRVEGGLSINGDLIIRFEHLKREPRPFCLTFSSKVVSRIFGLKCSLETHVTVIHENIKEYKCVICNKFLRKEVVLKDTPKYIQI
jgi:hypothetical protein